MTIKKLTSQAKELTLAIEEETIGRDSAKAALGVAEKRANEMALLVDESGLALEQSERARKMAESAAADTNDRLAEVEGLYNAVAEGKRKAEADYFALQDEIEALEDNAKAAASTADQSRALLATQIGELQGQLADAEAASGRGLKQEVRKLELRILELESDVDSAGRQSLTVAK